MNDRSAAVHRSPFSGPFVVLSIGCLHLGVHCRDVIDLAMIHLSKSEFSDGLLERCMRSMDISVPRALLWQNIRKMKSYMVVGTPK